MFDLSKAPQQFIIVRGEDLKKLTETVNEKMPEYAPLTMIIEGAHSPIYTVPMVWKGINR